MHLRSLWHPSSNYHAQHYGLKFETHPSTTYTVYPLLTQYTALYVSLTIKFNWTGFRNPDID